MHYSTPVTTARKRKNDHVEDIDVAIFNEIKASKPPIEVMDGFEGYGKMVAYRLRNMDPRKSSLTMTRINCLLHEMEYDETT